MTAEEQAKRFKPEKEDNTLYKDDYRIYMNNLRVSKDIKTSLLSLFKLIRDHPKTLLSKDKDKIIGCLAAIMKNEPIDLKIFIEDEVFYEFDIEKYKKQFTGLIKTVNQSNKKQLQKILARLIDLTQDKNDIIRRVLLEISQDDSYNDVFLFTKRSYEEIINQELDKMDDREYIIVFCGLKSLSNHVLRNFNETKGKNNVSSTEKYKYIKKVVETGFINDILPFYYNDKDVKIRQLLSGSKFANNSSIISRFLNDHNPVVRCNMIDNLEAEDALNMNLDIFDRVFDIDDSVRHKAFEFYDKFFNYVRSHHFISYFLNKSEPVFWSDTEKKKMRIDENDSKISTNVTYALMNLFKGLYTVHKNEYLLYIDKLDLSIDFYVKHLSMSGVELYLEQKRGDVFTNYNYKDFNDKQKRIFLTYSEEMLPENDTVDLIKNDLISAMFYLRDKDITNFVSNIYENLIKNDFPLPFKILTLERLMRYKVLLMHKQDESPKDLVVASFLFEEFDVDMSELIFDNIFYLAKRGKLEANRLNEYSLPNCELIEILIASQSLEMLSIVTDRLFENVENFKNLFNERMKLGKNINNKSFDDFISESEHNMYLYLLLFGHIKSSSIAYFISFLHFLASSTSNKRRVSKFYKEYLNNVPKTVYNEFASVCYNLKTKSIYPQDEQEYNVIRNKDEMLYYIISIVLNHNVYKVNEKRYDLDMFYDVIEENLSLVLSSH